MSDILLLVGLGSGGKKGFSTRAKSPELPNIVDHLVDGQFVLLFRFLFW